MTSAAQVRAPDSVEPRRGPPGPNYHKIMERRARLAEGGERPMVIEVMPMARRARPRARHWGLVLSFLLLVVAPAVATGWYLEERAAPQFESRVGFSVRAEEAPAAGDIFGGMMGFSSASSKDTDVLYEFIQSAEMVARVDARLGLRGIYSVPSDDPVFALRGTSREDLADYWPRMVRVYYDRGTGLIEVRSFAFTATDAKAVADAVFEESSRMINELSAIARSDATHYAEEELARARDRLAAARAELTAFRSRTQIVDPRADIEGQMGLLNTLQAQLAEVMVEHDLLAGTTRANDPRIEQANRRIEAIEGRIAEERRKLGVGDGSGYAEVVGEFERLQVDLEFAQQQYVAAQAAYDLAQAEAQRKSRYLAAYQRPTLAETATGPDKLLLIALVAGFAFLGWAVLSLVYYSLRDRR